MRGPEGAQALVEAWLAAVVPAALDAQAARLGLVVPRDPEVLPNPQLQAPQEVGKLAVNQFPALIVTVWDLTRLERVAVDPGDLDDGLPGAPTPTFGDRWRATYLLRVFAFARGKDHATTNAARFRYALALRESLLGHPAIGSAGVAQVDETTWRESYSEVTKDAQRTIGAMYAEFELTMLEDLTAPAPGVVDTLDVYPLDLPGAVTAIVGR